MCISLSRIVAVFTTLSFLHIPRPLDLLNPSVQWLESFCEVGVANAYFPKSKRFAFLIEIYCGI